MSLSDANIFHARQILRNFRAKKSAFVDNHRNFVQILCLVSDTNVILVHCNHYGEPNNNNTNSNNKDAFGDDGGNAKVSSTRSGGGVGGGASKTSDGDTFASNWKLIVWFQRMHKQIQGLCFDPNGSQLLVVCYDNTLHIVPILWIINPECGLKTTTSQEIENFYWPFRSDEITSFIVPFSGPHECSNSKTCPNNANDTDASADKDDDNDKYTPAQINEMVLSNSLYQSFYMNEERIDESDKLVHEKSPDGCEKQLPDEGSEPKVDGNCPYPLSVVWWIPSKCDEQNRQHRALIGYSDGSICVVGLTPNCPFIANTSIDNKSGGIEKMTICRDPIVKSVSLLINSSTKEQWKLLLEQNSIGYTFPDDIQNCSVDGSTSQSNGNVKNATAKPEGAEDDWQIIIPVPCEASENDSRLSGDDDDEIDNKDEFVHLNAEVGAASTMMTIATTHTPGGIFPAARARLASLRDLGAKKIGALKLKLIENKIKSNERDRNRQHMTPLACMHIPSFSPEILTTPAGPYFIVQYLKGSHLLSALHPYSDTLSVHSMDISLIPLHIYKIPKDCTEILITPYIMFTKQTIAQSQPNHDNETTDPKTESEINVENCESIDTSDENVNINAIGVIGCNTTALRIGEDSEFNKSSMLSIFPLPDEDIVDIHRAPFRPNVTHYDNVGFGCEQNNDAADSSNVTHFRSKITAQNYLNHQLEQQHGCTGNAESLFDFDDRRVIEHEFPIIDLDKCIVVTNRSLYFIEFRDHPHIVFLNLVRDGKWKACEEFCKIFDLDFNQCIEYAGDVLLKKKKTTQALLTYNVAKIPPVKTALKLAMFGQNGALMHLCAMALKIVYLLRSTAPKNHTIKYLLDSIPLAMGNSIETKKPKKSKNDLNFGLLSSDFSYDRDDTPGDLQMSNPSQFHLSNLLLLTLTEKAIKDKQFMPLWNFLVTNKRYHTNMSSIVLSQSGLYSSTIVLALNRGAHMDAFCALVGVTNQEFGWYSEINDILHNLSDPIFIECIIYLQHVSIDYFDCIQLKIDKINEHVLQRLRRQLDPFAAIFRPVVSQLSSNFIESDTNDINKKLIEFCRHLIETFLIICIRLYTIKYLRDDVCNGLNMIYVRHEENQFAIKVDHHATLSAGFSHCAAIVDGSCYIWGSNGINCALNNNNSSSGGNDFGTEATPKCLEFISCMGLEVHAVKCGKAHTLILTNNGLYAMGSNMMGQLGIGGHQIQALQPMLVPDFEGKNVTIIEAGQYHNAIYADGELYTWGWGIYGQLGHGDVFLQDRPKIVKFFTNKVVKQVSLGHAHSLVLCGSKLNANETVLYVFGCNLFGQLGTGQKMAGMPHQKFLKSSVPLRIDLAQETITQIHTKFFTNFVITKSNKIYTWGASPQLIRLMNQARKRARLAQKFEETKTTIVNESGETDAADPNCSDFNQNFTEEATIESNDRDRKENIKNSKSLHTNDTHLPFLANGDNGEMGNPSNGNNRQLDGGELIDDIESRSNKDSLIMDKSNLPSTANLEERIKKFLKSKTSSSQAAVSCDNSSSEPESSVKLNGKNGSNRSTDDFEDECTEHLYPSRVDSSNVVGEIIQVSSGLYHNALVTTKSQLYTWGKNLEKQLGRESSRCDLSAPTLLELNDNVIFVECGADFTIIMTDYYTVRAFGNNNYGQCGREISVANDRNSIAGKLVRLRVSKRVVRLPDNSQCVDHPMEVPLPRPKIRMNFDAVRYLKSVPKFRDEFILRDILETTSCSQIYSDEDDGNSASPDPADDTNLANKLSALNLSSKSATGNDQMDISSDFIHYCLFIFHGIYDPHKILESATLSEFKVRILMLNYYVKEAFSLCLIAAKTTIQATTIPSKKQSTLADKDLDATVDCQRLSDYVIKLFQYFTKDVNIVPIHRTDLKYLIHAIFMYFIKNALPLEPIESYFLSNIDHYLFGLAIVLYFNNNNSKLEQQVQQKYAHLFSGCAVNDSAYNLHSTGTAASAANGNGGADGSCNNATDSSTPEQREKCKIQNEDMMLDFEVIFNNVSTSFKTIICQRLIEFDNDLN